MPSQKVMMRIFSLALALVASSCASRTPTSAFTPVNPDTQPAPTETPWPTRDLWSVTPEVACSTLTYYDPYDMPPEFFYTPTPDPNGLTVTVEISGEHTQEEIAGILFAKWLDHFLDKSISPEWRLSEYTIDQITIPSRQTCAQKLGGLFMAEAVVTARTFLPPVSQNNRCGQRSDWFLSWGPTGNIDDTSVATWFIAVISKSGEMYTLLVITSSPPC